MCIYPINPIPTFFLLILTSLAVLVDKLENKPISHLLNFIKTSFCKVIALIVSLLIASAFRFDNVLKEEVVVVERAVVGWARVENATTGRKMGRF